jgi:hypothetical protein
MPIRINLLAEEQEAEEMRRRDPIKRAVIIGVLLILLMVVWIGLTQMNVNAARADLIGHQARLQKIEESSKQVRSNQLLVAELAGKIEALERYTTNRFFWGTFLDAVQQTALDTVRLTELRTSQNYTSGDANKFFTTNIVVKFSPPAPWWKFWAGSGPKQEISTLASNTFSTFIKGPPFHTNVLTYKVNITPASTNAALGQATAKAEFVSSPWAMEQAVVQISGRDYGNPPGAGADELLRRLNTSTFLKPLLELGRFVQRPPQARPPDSQDPDNPTAPFLPFTIELTLKERVLTNE